MKKYGITIREDDLEYICMYRDAHNDNYINFFLKTGIYEGIPSIMEKNKCNELIWCDINHIPDNTILSDKRAIKNYLSKKIFDENNF